VDDYRRKNPGWRNEELQFQKLYGELEFQKLSTEVQTKKAAPRVAEAAPIPKRTYLFNPRVMLERDFAPSCSSERPTLCKVNWSHGTPPDAATRKRLELLKKLQALLDINGSFCPGHTAFSKE
jgi:hypothetical protein